MVGSSIHPPKFKREFILQKKKMEVFFKIGFKIMLCIKYDFELPKNENGEKLKEHSGTKMKWENSWQTVRLSLIC